jgi:hypothetical protein
MSLDEAIIPGNRPAAKWPGGTDLNLFVALTFVNQSCFLGAGALMLRPFATHF